MGNLGKWGVTRDADGTLSGIWEWPWYWRYPTGIAMAAVALYWAWSIQGKGPEWHMWAVAVGGLLVALSMMYELGCLAMVAALIGGTWLASDALFPDFETPQWLEIFVVVGFAYYAWYTGNQALLLAKKNERSLQSIWDHLAPKNDDRAFHYDDLYARMRETEGRLRMLERQLGGRDLYDE